MVPAWTLNSEVDEERSLQVEKALRDSEEFARVLSANVPAALLIIRDGRIIYANSAVEEVAGYTPAEALQFEELPLAPEFVELMKERESAVLAGGEAEVREIEIIGKHGERRWLESTGRRIAFQGAPAVLAVLLDVTGRKHAELKLKQEERFRRVLTDLMGESLRSGLDPTFFQRLLDSAIDAIPGAQAGSLLMRNEQGLFSFQAVHGFDMDALRQVSFEQWELERERPDGPPHLVLDHAARSVGDPVRQLALSEGGRLTEIEVTLSFPITISDTVCGYFNLDNFESPAAFSKESVDMARIFASNATSLLRRFDLERDLRDKQRELEQEAFFDALTNLPNRRYLATRLARSIEAGVSTGRGFRLVFVDLDDFKVVNDMRGHDQGDELIKAVADRLRDAVGEDGTAARWGGDEFVLILPCSGPVDDASALARRLSDILSSPYQVGNQQYMVTASIGLSCYPEHGTTSAELLKCADIALNRAKVTGKNSAVLFTSQLSHDLLERLVLERDLRKWLSTQLFLEYQPRVELETLSVSSVEALVRWRHPDLGLIPPTKFIPIAEETGLIDAVGREVLDLACKQARVWRDRGITHRVALNVSAKQLHGDGLIEDVAEVLRMYGLPGSSLELEVTESAAMTDVEDSIEKLRRLREMV